MVQLKDNGFVPFRSLGLLLYKPEATLPGGQNPINATCEVNTKLIKNCMKVSWKWPYIQWHVHTWCTKQSCGLLWTWGRGRFVRLWHQGVPQAGIGINFWHLLLFHSTPLNVYDCYLSLHILRCIHAGKPSIETNYNLLKNRRGCCKGYCHLIAIDYMCCMG